MARYPLSQIRPADTSATKLFSAPSNVRVTLDTLVICNTSGAATSCRVYHDARISGGADPTFDESTAIMWDVTVKAGQSIWVTAVAGLFEKPNSYDAALGVRSADASALTFTLYGDDGT